MINISWFLFSFFFPERFNCPFSFSCPDDNVWDEYLDLHMLISQNSSSSPHMCICLLWQGGLVWLPWKRSLIWPQFSGSKTGLFSKPATVLNLMLGVTGTGSGSLGYSCFQQSEAFPSGWTDSQSLRWHLCRSSCPAPLLRAMSCWVSSISKDRDFAAPLDDFFQYWWTLTVKKAWSFFLCFGLFLSYT